MLALGLFGREPDAGECQMLPVTGMGLPCNFLLVVASIGPECAWERAGCIQGLVSSSSEPESNPRHPDVHFQLSTILLPSEVVCSSWRVFHE